MEEIEIKKRKMERLYRQCIIILEYTIEYYRRRGKDDPYGEIMKEGLKKRYEEDKDNIKLLSRNVSGYRMALKDLHEDIRDYLKKEELAELKQRIVDELGPDID
jgi:tRNA A37 methylthiotransferase MiaB